MILAFSASSDDIPLSSLPSLSNGNTIPATDQKGRNAFFPGSLSLLQTSLGRSSNTSKTGASLRILFSCPTPRAPQLCTPAPSQPGRTTMPTLDLSELNITITILGTKHSFQQKRFTANGYQVPLPYSTVLDQSRSSKYGILARLSQQYLRASYSGPVRQNSSTLNDGGMLLRIRLRRSHWYALVALHTSGIADF
jgi:hypothetical protein